MKRSKKILVVDDEKGIRFLLSEVLLSKGFEVCMAKDGQESLDQLEKDNFDLVITDINMPRLDGIAMLKTMKKSGRREKVIVMTANPSDKRLLGTDVPDVLAHLHKPFNINSFLNTVVVAMANAETIS
ncbi:MAG: response regulator [Thermodesulfobacteriota bacterium]|nr:response regulator [Thermodesulfobacteriota bacterium]